jgi:hypothetical protein
MNAHSTVTPGALVRGSHDDERRARVTALVIGAVAVLHRAVLVGLGTPPTNSDEAVLGLASLHIAQGRDAPVYLYGQDYMGMLEAYLAAPLIRVFGAGVVPVRAPLLVLFALFLVVMYQLSRRLWSPGVAVATVLVLSLGADRVLSAELTASGGYPEIALLGALLFLLAVRLARGESRRPPLTLAGFGLAAGAAIWSDPLVAPYVAAATLLLVVTSWRHLRGWGAVALPAGALGGAAPMIWHDLRAAPGHDTFSALTAMSGTTGPLGERLHGALGMGLPMVANLCPGDRCGAASLWWPPVYLTLLAVSGWLAVRALRRGGADVLPGVAGLMLVGAAVVTLVAYARSFAPVFDPVGNARYLHCLLITTPVLVAAVARAWRWSRAPRLMATVAAGLVVAMMFWSTAAYAGTAARNRVLAQERAALVAALRYSGETRVYSEYWSCHWLTFLSGERVMCGVLDDMLQPGWERYPGWAAAVRAAPRVAYLAQVGAPFDFTVRSALDRSGIAVRTETLHGYHLYVPLHPGARLLGT